jgi:hypothetical protein
VLVNGLPPEAAISRVDGQQWTSLHELLATTLERVDAWGLINARLQAPKKAQKYLPCSPLEVPRPGEAAAREARDRVVTDPAEIAAFFN